MESKALLNSSDDLKRILRRMERYLCMFSYDIHPYDKSYGILNMQINGLMMMKKYAMIAVVIIVLAAIGLLLTSSKSGSTGNAVLDSSVAPDFTLKSTTGEEISLSDYKSKNNVLLYFQEGVMCPPCWTQMVDMESRIDEFNKKDIRILTITTDRLYQSKNYAKQFGTNLPVLADEDKSVSRIYDALKDSMHPGQTPGHLFVLVDKDGIIRWRYSAYSSNGASGDHHSSGSGRMYVPVDEILGGIGRSL